MRLYETLCLLRPDLEEEKLEESIERIRSVIQENGGEVLELQKWGKKRLAYLVEECQDGYYALITYKANQDALDTLKHLFKVNEAYLRYMTIRLEEKDEDEAQQEEEEEVQEEAVAAEEAADTNAETKEGEVSAE